MVAQTRTRGRRLSPEPRFDYTTIGHVTIDVLADGSRRAGGAAFYSALQAARLGQRTRIITQGVPAEIEALLEPYRDEFELEIIAAAQTTTLDTRGEGSGRTQRLLAWAGPIATAPVAEHGHPAPRAGGARDTAAVARESAFRRPDAAGPRARLGSRRRRDRAGRAAAIRRSRWPRAATRSSSARMSARAVRG